MFTVFGFYKFKKSNFLKKNKEFLQREILKNNISGTIILSQEGINGTIAGKRRNISQIIKSLKKVLNFKDFDSKNMSQSHFQPFHKGKIKIKNEVVPLGLKINSNNKKLNRYISGKSWNKLISNKETLVVDARKPFEYDVGTFKNSINPNIQNFRDFPKYLKKIDKAKPVAMFCTGGIRCEKSTAYLKENGFDEVYHLEGGILKYLEEVPKDQTLWQGECFVFDNRVAVNHDLEKGSYDQCHACRMPITEKEKESKYYQPGLACHHCHDTVADDRKQRFAERQKQVELARERGEDHIGNAAMAATERRRAAKKLLKQRQDRGN